MPPEIFNVPTHPMLVHFPIGFFFGALIFSIVALFSDKLIYRELVFWNLLLAVIFGIPTALTGLQQYNTIVHNERIHDLMQEHMIINLCVVGLLLVLTPWSWRRRNHLSRLGTTFFIILMLAGAGALTYSGHLGGLMVFEEGAAVAPMKEIIKAQSGHGGSGHPQKSEGNEGGKDSHDNSESHKH